MLFLHPDSLSVGLAAARAAGIRSDRIVLFDRPHAADLTSPPPAAAELGVDVRALITLEELVHEGLAQPRRWAEPRLKPGEGKTKLALLFFSSGTTGRPKAVMIPHHSVIANCVQMKRYVDLKDGGLPNEKKTWAAGDVALGGAFGWLS